MTIFSDALELQREEEEPRPTNVGDLPQLPTAEPEDAPNPFAAALTENFPTIPTDVPRIPGEDLDALRVSQAALDRFGAAASKGVSRIVGLPADVFNAGIRVSAAVRGGIKPEDIPQVTRFTGDEMLRFFNLAGVGREQERISLKEKVIGAVGEEIGAAGIPAGGVLSKAAKAGRVARMGQAPTPLMLSAAQNPTAFTAGEVGAAAGAGTARGTLEEFIQPGIGGSLAGELAGSVVGGGVGAGVVSRGQNITGAARALKREFEPLTGAGQERIAAGIVQDAATDPRAAVRALKQPDPDLIQGAAFSTGQITNDPGLLALERGLIRSSAEVKGEFIQADSATNQVLRDRLRLVAEGRSRGCSIDAWPRLLPRPRTRSSSWAAECSTRRRRALLPGARLSGCCAKHG
jgi:hypothetical protein